MPGKKASFLRPFCRNWLWHADDRNQAHDGLNKALPDTDNTIVGLSRDEQRYLLLTTSDTNAGTYFLGDRETKALSRIASRSYAVLQMNFPGSAGYGGYAALMAAARNSDPYECVASFAGVTDVASLVKHSRKFTNDEVVKEQIGTDYESLSARSPGNLAEQIDDASDMLCYLSLLWDTLPFTESNYKQNKEPLMYQPPTAPLSIGGVLDHGFRLMRACFTGVIGLAFLSAIVNAIPGLIVPQPDLTANPSLPASFIAFSLVAVLFGVVLYGAILARIDAVVKSTQLSFMDSIGVGMRRFFPILFCFILYSLAVTLGFLALIVPAVILMLSLGMGPYLVVTDNMGPLAALKESHRLIWGHWWRTAAIVTVIMFITLSAYFLVGTLTGVSAVMSNVDDLQGINIAATVTMALLSAFITPLAYSFGMALLHDLKLRKEGSDLEDRIEALAGA